MTPATILLTGFEPFGGDAVNPSWRVARALHGERIGGRRCMRCNRLAGLARRRGHRHGQGVADATRRADRDDPGSHPVRENV